MPLQTQAVSVSSISPLPGCTGPPAGDVAGGGVPGGRKLLVGVVSARAPAAARSKIAIPPITPVIDLIRLIVNSLTSARRPSLSFQGKAPD
jgi:hypothetical protein